MQETIRFAKTFPCYACNRLVVAGQTTISCSNCRSNVTRFLFETRVSVREGKLASCVAKLMNLPLQDRVSEIWRLILASKEGAATRYLQGWYSRLVAA
ncbi:hypothetical protein L0156_10430 [bacterium]|nr:hypothetical protein [bacterium]